MDKITDFFKAARERVSSPFMLSFLISWCLWNWEIVIAVLFYSLDELNKIGYNHSLLGFISCKLGWWVSLGLPIASATIYTLLSPLVSWAITWYEIQISKRSENNYKKIADGAVVPVQKFLDYKKKYEETLKELSSIYVDEKKIITALENEQNNKLQLAKELNDLRLEKLSANETHTRELATLLQKHNLEIEQRNNYLNAIKIPSILVGTWRISLHDITKNHQTVFNAKILYQAGNIFFYNTEESSDIRPHNLIRHFFHFQNEIHFVSYKIIKERGSTYDVDLKTPHVTNLTIHDNDNLEGSTNELHTTYQRIGKLTSSNQLQPIQITKV